MQESHPGLGPGLRGNRVYMPYYAWIPFFLFLQVNFLLFLQRLILYLKAVVAWIPTFAWCRFEGENYQSAMIKNLT